MKNGKRGLKMVPPETAQTSIFFRNAQRNREAVTAQKKEPQKRAKKKRQKKLNNKHKSKTHKELFLVRFFFCPATGAGGLEGAGPRKGGAPNGGPKPLWFESPDVHIRGTRPSKHHQNSTRRPPGREREKKKAKFAAGEEKRAKFWAVRVGSRVSTTTTTQQQQPASEAATTALVVATTLMHHSSPRGQKARAREGDFELNFAAKIWTSLPVPDRLLDVSGPQERVQRRSMEQLVDSPPVISRCSCAADGRTAGGCPLPRGGV